MKRYRKAIVAAAGVIALAVMRAYDIEVMGLESIVLETVVSALTAFGVYQVPNA